MLTKFNNLSLERKLLVLLFVICIVLPFSIIRAPTDFPQSFIFLTSFHAGISHWLEAGKSFWQGYLICYGIATTEMLSLYFGIFGVQSIWRWLKKQLEKGIKFPFSKNQLLILKETSRHEGLNNYAKNNKRRLIGWLNERSNRTLLIVLLLPLPYSDLPAVTILATRRPKYGHWQIATVNIPHILLVVWLVKIIGIDFLFFLPF